MQIIERRIPYTYGDTIRLKPIADVHLGHRLCDEKAFKHYLSDENALFVGIGDLLDSIIVSDAKRYRKSMDGTEGMDVVDEQIRKAIGYLTPIKERLIGLGDGNHEEALHRHGINPTRRICEELGVPYIGYASLIRLSLSEGNRRTRTVVMRVHHGWGGGSRTQGADLTKFSKDCAYWDGDLFAYGHVHKLQHDEIPRLGLVGTKLVAKPKLMCICGTFQKTMSPDALPSWAETKGFPPTTIGGLTINIKPTRDWVRMWVSGGDE